MTVQNMFRATLAALAVLVLLIPAGAAAQPATAPTVNAAEQAFDRGLRAYRAGDYTTAHEAFMRTATGFEYNQRTTAAHLMAGKSLYAAGDFDRASSVLTNLIAEYPRSRYVEEARRVRREATEHARRPRVETTVTTIGVLLPMGAGDELFTQAMFNGIRLAVDEHNAAHPTEPARLVFRQSGADGVTAADAVAALAREGARVIIGPLYSEEAIAAGGAAERQGVVLVTPLATDHRVSEGRRYVFQANPTFHVRGRTMARYAAEQNLGRVGVVAARGSYAEVEADAFVDEAVLLGQEIVFSERLPSGEAWFQLPERIGEHRLAQVDALFLPITGSGAPDYAAGALRGLDQMLAALDRTPPVVLGNAEWHGLADPSRGARFAAVVSSDYYPAPSASGLRAFEGRYRDLSGVAPDRLAYAGYDVASLVLERTRRAGDDVAEALRNGRPFDGLAHRIDFAGSQVNQELELMQFRQDRLQPLRR